MNLATSAITSCFLNGFLSRCLWRGCGNASGDFTHVHGCAKFTHQMPEAHVRPHDICEVRIDQLVPQGLLSESPPYFHGLGVLMLIPKIYHEVRGALGAVNVKKLFNQGQNFSLAGEGHVFSVSDREVIARNRRSAASLSRHPRLS